MESAAGAIASWPGIRTAFSWALSQDARPSDKVALPCASSFQQR